MEIEQTGFSLQNKLKQEVLDDDRPKRINQPSESELCETVLLLKQIMPHRSLQRAIIMLYETLVKKKKPQQIYDQILKSIPNRPLNTPLLQQQQAQSNTRNEVTKTYQKDDLQKKTFSEKAEQNRYKDKRLVAKCFVAKGYGHQFALDQFSKAKYEPSDKASSSFNKEVYKQTISVVITQAFRKLQSFLIDDCKRKLTPLTKEQMKKLMTPLLSSSTFGQNLAIFKKYLRLLFGLSNVTLMEGQSIKFYLQALKHLNGGRIITIEQIEANSNNPQEKPQVSQTNSQKQQCLKNPSIAAKKFEQNVSKTSTRIKLQKYQSQNKSPQQIEIAKLYILYQSLSKCYSHLNTKYDTISKFKFRFFSILRSSLKNVQKYNTSQKQIKLYNEADIEWILRKGIKIRLTLLQYFLNPHNKNEAKIIQQINELLQNREQKQQIESSLQQDTQNDIFYELEDQVKQEQKCQ